MQNFECLFSKPIKFFCSIFSHLPVVISIQEHLPKFCTKKVFYDILLLISLVPSFFIFQGIGKRVGIREKGGGARKRGGVRGGGRKRYRRERGRMRGEGGGIGKGIRKGEGESGWGKGGGEGVR